MVDDAEVRCRERRTVDSHGEVATGWCRGTGRMRALRADEPSGDDELVDRLVGVNDVTPGRFLSSRQHDESRVHGGVIVRAHDGPSETLQYREFRNDVRRRWRVRGNGRDRGVALPG